MIKSGMAINDTNGITKQMDSSVLAMSAKKRMNAENEVEICESILSISLLNKFWIRPNGVQSKKAIGERKMD